STLRRPSTGADLNQGKVSNGRKCSTPLTISQKPWREMLSTSTAEVLLPRRADLILIPELRFAALSLHVNVRPGLLAREEVEAQSARRENGRAHETRVPPHPSPSTKPRRHVG